MAQFTCQCHHVTFMENWRTLNPEKKAMYRDEINKKEILSRCEAITAGMVYDSDKLDKGDFMIARISWNKTEEKYHDHWAFLERR